MQNNIDYWKRRQIREAFNVFSQAEIAADEIAKLYIKASAYMTAKMQGVYDKFKRKYGLTDEQAKQLLAAASDRGSIDAALQALKNGPQTEPVTELRKVVESAAYAARIQQMRELEISAGQVMSAIYKQELAKNTALYQKLITDSYRRSIFAIQQRAGIAFSFSDVNPKLMDRLLHSKWSGKNYSARLWGNTQEVAENVKEQIILGALTGKTEREMAEVLNETFAKGARASRRLIRTESNYIFTQADMAARKECDIRRYMYLATLDMKTCAETCGKLDGRIFLVKDQKPGYNCPPMHPWCVLPDTKIIAPDAEAMTQSYYSGDVIEMLTANGTRLTVTPNHIVLTSRGWVRAKNLAKGDKVIYYRGWNKAGAESDPTNDNSIPTIEQLFASAVEASGGTSCRVPASAVDFKGDVVPQSEINIVNIDSKLRDKLDPAARKLVSDVLLVEAGEASKIALNGKCFVKQFLAGLGLAADGIMSGLNVAHVLRMGTLTHHELVGLRISTDYDTRLFETENNDVSGNSKGIRDFVDGFPSVVMLDDIVDVKIRKFSGHVYDASSLSTLYIANGIITSNCRCTTLSIISDEWIKTQTRRARDPETGRTYKVPLSMTYGEWKKKYLVPDKYIKENAIDENIGRESGITNKKLAKQEAYKINRNYIQSNEYKRKFNGISGNSEVDNEIYKCSKAALIHRDGTDCEDLYIISASSGKVLGKNVASTEHKGVSPNDSVKTAVRENVGNAIGLHTHFDDTPPTGSDFEAAYKRRYQFGVVANATGAVYKYGCGGKYVSQKLIDGTIEKYKLMLDTDGHPVYSDYREAHLAALDSLRESWGIWYEAR